MKRILLQELSLRKILRGQISPSLATSRAVIADCLIALMCTCVVAQSGYGASRGSRDSSDLSASSLTTSPVIVVGFLGGFVRRDEAHHPEVQLIRSLSQEYPEHVYFGLFENSKVDEAYLTILNRLGANQDGALSSAEKREARIILFGHSWGASAVVSLSRKLERKGVPVLLTVQVDSVAKPFQNDRVIPSNVREALNLYASRSLVIHGRSTIVAADPSRTTILGNFKWDYKGKHVDCRGVPWYALWLTRSHIEIERDPKLWSQVRTLMRSKLPQPAVTQTACGEPDARGSGSDRAAPCKEWTARDTAAQSAAPR